MSASSSLATHPSVWRALLLRLLIALRNLAMWAVLNQPVQIPDWPGKVASGSPDAPYQRYQNPNDLIYPTTDEIDADLKLLSKYTDRIRTYSGLENPSIPAIAKKYGLKVTAGTYLDHRDQHDDDEIAALIQLARDNDNIDEVLVGNETLLRNDMGVDKLIRYIDRVRAQTKARVSTAEPWHVWEKYPQLAKHVDFITTHLLPYWEKIPRKDAVGIGVLARYNELQSRFPGKHIVVGEVGWPSAGDRKETATPSIEDESQVLHQWVKEAAWRHIDYFIVEAFDQPWKETFEGRAGPYWGVFNADRQPKFDFNGHGHVEDPGLAMEGAHRTLLALLPMFWFVRHFIRWLQERRPGVLCILIQLSASVLVWSATLPYAFYPSPFDWAMLIVLFPGSSSRSSSSC